MEIATKGMTATKNPLINLMTTIYFINHQKRQVIDFRRLFSNKTKSISALALKFSK